MSKYIKGTYCKVLTNGIFTIYCLDCIGRRNKLYGGIWFGFLSYYSITTNIPVPNFIL